MSIIQLIDEVMLAGVSIQLSDRGTLKLSGLTERNEFWVATIRECKAEIIEILEKRAIRLSEQEPTEAERVGCWTEEEVLVTQRRAQWFVEQGLSELGADRVACRLVQRDRDVDDRSTCLECIQLRRGRCRDGLEPVGGGGVNVLHRCPNFKDYGGF